MKRYIAQTTLIALAGASLTYLALTATPLRAQGFGKRVFQSPNSESGWVIPQYAQGYGHGPGWGRGQRWGGNGNGGPCLMYNGVYDPEALETIRGRVVSVNQYGPGQGAWVQVQTDQETVEVHLGPVWYLEQEGIAIAPNDEIEVTGVSNTTSGETTLFASEVKLGDTVVPLRDNAGYPRWMNWNNTPDNS